jgi:AraC-like DNA-binding protein
MIFRSYRPSLLLEPFIEVIHLRHFVFPPHTPLPFKPYPPRPEHCIAFYVRGCETTEYPFDGLRIKRPRSALSGQHTQQINRYVSPEFLMILVVFKPGALFRFTRIPFQELMNTAVDAEAVFGNALTRLNERLNSTDSYDEMIALVTEFLCAQAGMTSNHDLQPVDKALQWFLQNPQALTVQQLAYHSCLSLRQLERKFLERVGVGPKTFLKIARFNQSYFMRLRRPHMTWQSVASSCGYADYQHLVKDYRAFTGSTAAQFFQSEEKAPERVLGLTK